MDKALEHLKKLIGDTVLRYVFIGIAVELAFNEKLKTSVIGFLKPIHDFSSIDQQHIVSVLSALISMLFAFIFTIVYKMRHTRHEICGRYISLPKGNKNQINIFDIESAGLISTDYQLSGERYSIVGGAAEHTGGWHAKRLDIVPSGSDVGVMYLYAGDKTDSKTDGGKGDDKTAGDKRGDATESDDTFEGHGLTKLILRGKKLDSGDGHWVDDERPPGRHETTYFKITYGKLPDVLLANRPWYRKFPTRFPWTMRDIADAYARLPPSNPLRQRPARAP